MERFTIIKHCVVSWRDLLGKPPAMLKWSWLRINNGGLNVLSDLRGCLRLPLWMGRKLYLVRDRFGKKPMFYYQGMDAFVFASEIKAIKPFLNSVTMNEEAMRSYLSFLAPTPPHTFYEGIGKLRDRGEYLCFESGKITKQ